MGSTSVRAPASQSPHGPQARRPNQIGIAPERVRIITGRLEKKKNAIASAA